MANPVARRQKQDVFSQAHTPILQPPPLSAAPASFPAAVQCHGLLTAPARASQSRPSSGTARRAERPRGWRLGSYVFLEKT